MPVMELTEHHFFTTFPPVLTGVKLVKTRVLFAGHVLYTVLRIDTGGCSVIWATPVFLSYCTHQSEFKYLLS